MQTAAAYAFHDRDEDARPTIRVPFATPCRSITGCCRASIGTTGRCELHADSAPPETATQRTRRLALELAAIGAAHVERNTSVPAGSWV